MKNKRVSIKDIAKKLNVSVTTVSFVLNGKAKEKRISEAVTKKILGYIREINYKPNQLAQSLRTGKSKILVFMVEDISNYFFAKLARLIEDLAYEKGYKVMFCSNENDAEKSIELINLFTERQVDGFIIIPPSGTREKIAELIAQDIPVVLFDRYFPGLDTHYVGIDNESASMKGVKHLHENGYKKTAFVTIDIDQTQMKGRLQGYKDAVAGFGNVEYTLKIPYGLKSSEQGKKLIKDFLIAHPELDSIFFATNYLTQIGLEVLKENFPNLKNELGVITFDDNDLFSIYTPSITAVCQPLAEMSSEVMNIMFNLLEEGAGEIPLKKVILNVSLEPRESTLRKTK